MVLKKAESQMRTMLSDTILALCRNTLPYSAEVSIEGLLGITLDNKEIFLVNINETLQKDGVSSEKHSQKETGKHKRKSESGESDYSSSQDEQSDSQSAHSAKRRRRRKRRKRAAPTTEPRRPSRPPRRPSG